MSDHDDGDWDSELGESLIDLVVDLGIGGWFGLVLVVGGIGLLVWHFASHFGS
jgi:hypothetical protein